MYRASLSAQLGQDGRERSRRFGRLLLGRRRHLHGCWHRLKGVGGETVGEPGEREYRASAWHTGPLRARHGTVDDARVQKRGSGCQEGGGWAKSGSRDPLHSLWHDHWYCVIPAQPWFLVFQQQSLSSMFCRSLLPYLCCKFSICSVFEALNMSFLNLKF